MASEIGISGEKVLTEQDINSRSLRVAVGSAVERATATLFRANRHFLKTKSLDTRIEGTDIVVELSRRARVGDTVQWQAYAP